MHRILRRDVLPTVGPAVAAERICLEDASRPHSHDFVELAVVASGSADHVSAAGRRRLGRGSVVVLRPGDWHGYDIRDHLTVHNVYVGVEIFQRELRWVLEDLTLGRLMRPAKGSHRIGGHPAGTLEPEALDRTECWLTVLESAPTGTVADRTARVGHLISLLGEVVTATQPHCVGAAAQGTIHPAVLDAARLLEEYVCEDWPLPKLARAVHLSPSYLTRLFTTGLGVPPSAFHGRLRAERAAALLIESDLPVAEIGRLVGWPDPNYASRRFRHFFAVGPAQYRSRFRPDS